LEVFGKLGERLQIDSWCLGLAQAPHSCVALRKIEIAPTLEHALLLLQSKSWEQRQKLVVEPACWI